MPGVVCAHRYFFKEMLLRAYDSAANTCRKTIPSLNLEIGLDVLFLRNLRSRRGHHGASDGQSTVFTISSSLFLDTAFNALLQDIFRTFYDITPGIAR